VLENLDGLTVGEWVILITGEIGSSRSVM